VRTAQGEQVDVIRARRSDAPARAAAGHRLTPAAEIALLCAREQIDVDPDGSVVPGRVERLRDRCGEVDDWPALVRTVGDLRIRPLVHQHLREVAADLVPDPALAELAVAARQDVLRNLQTAEVHLRLHRDILAPMGVPHVFVKGATLAHRFYAQPNLRVARDVDVLVPRDALLDIGHRLRDLGYRADHPQFGTDAGLRYTTRVLGSMNWLSPEGVLIEVHSALSFEGGRLPADRLLAAPDHVVVAGMPLPTLPLAETVGHVCLHHTRSSWTRLHWVADLDAILRATGGDPHALIASALALRFGRVVAASLGLHGMLASPDPRGAGPPRVVSGGDGDDARRAAALVDACLAGLMRSDAPPGAPAVAAVRRATVRVALADLGPRDRARMRARRVRSWFRSHALLLMQRILPRRSYAVLRSAYFRLRPSLRLPRGRFDPASARR